MKAHVLTDYANCASIIRWRASDILIVLDDEQTDDPIITAEITTPAGAISVMAAVAVREKLLVLTGLHIHRIDDAATRFGAPNLRRLADAVMEVTDCDGILVKGAPRTTGANPGGRQILRFRRRFFAEG